MSAKHAILGLVIEQPSYASRIATEAHCKLQFAAMSGSYPYWALDKLEIEGLVRQVYESDVPGGGHKIGGKGLYEATSKGAQAFEAWLHSTPHECSLRDDIQFRLAVARPSDVSRLIEIIRDRELVCLKRERALMQTRPIAAKNNCALSDVAREVELIFWHGRLAWLRSLREGLEAISPQTDVQR